MKGKYQIPAQLLPIPDQVDAEMPRFTFISNKFHSLINVSQISASINIKYTDAYLKDYDKCEEYLKERIGIMFPAIEEITGNIKYCGLLTKVNYIVMDIEEKELIKYICDKFVSKNNYSTDVKDINLRYTVNKNEKYFINFNISNNKNYISDKPVSGPISVSDMKLENLGLQIILDINDRHAFNKDGTHKTTESEIKEIISMTKDIVNTKIDTILQKGEIKLC
ncbi:MAG: hypothetical protein ABH952_12645 [Candidatus Omnitrophota bacterium]